jgi:NMD protein affecting ribosome stability and mRNA decay
MLCFSCGKQKNELEPKKSDIINGVTLLLCQSCLESKLEPRWVVILGGRQNGTDSVRDYIVKRRYLGNTISAEELMA